MLTGSLLTTDLLIFGIPKDLTKKSYTTEDKTPHISIAVSSFLKKIETNPWIWVAFGGSIAG